VTQGIFIEGGLTRDGAFQKPKLGMLDYLVTAKRDPEFSAPLYIIPTAVNFDRVLEDRNLTEELLGREERSTKGEKLKTTFDYLFRNFFRGLFKRFKRYGYAVVTFGRPVSVDEFARAHPELLSATFDARKPSLQALAETVMSEISRAIPVTPVPLVATIFTRRPVLTNRQMLEEIERVREQWRDRPWLLREKTPAEIWKAARNVLELRHLIVPVEQWRDDLFDQGGVPEIEDAWQWDPEQRLLRDYYANSLMTFEDVKRRGWPERKRDRETEAAVAAARASEAT
jgi:glycerol-3-phosphate O-acyltransferase